MFGLSLFEIIFLGGLALIVLGPKQLPEVARTLGRFMTELRRTSNMMMAELQESAKPDYLKKQDPPSPFHPTHPPADHDPHHAATPTSTVNGDATGSSAHQNLLPTDASVMHANDHHLDTSGVSLPNSLPDSVATQSLEKSALDDLIPDPNLTHEKKS